MGLLGGDVILVSTGDCLMDDEGCGRAKAGAEVVGVFGLLTPRGCLTGDLILGRLDLWLSESSESESSIYSTWPLGNLCGREDRLGWGLGAGRVG